MYSARSAISPAWETLQMTDMQTCTVTDIKEIAPESTSPHANVFSVLGGLVLGKEGT